MESQRLTRKDTSYRCLLQHAEEESPSSPPARPDWTRLDEESPLPYTHVNQDPSLTLFRQPQEQHIAVRASSPAGGRSHFEFVVLAPAEAPKLCALQATQQHLCPWRPLAPGVPLGPEQGRV